MCFKESNRKKITNLKPKTYLNQLADWLTKSTASANELLECLCI